MFTERELIIAMKMLLISLYDSGRLKAKQKDRISEMLKITNEVLVNSDAGKE